MSGGSRISHSNQSSPPNLLLDWREQTDVMAGNSSYLMFIKEWLLEADGGERPTPFGAFLIKKMGINKIEVTDKEYNDFVDKNIVSEKRLHRIAMKVIRRIPLTVREDAIFNGKTNEINDYIVKINNTKKR